MADAEGRNGEPREPQILQGIEHKPLLSRLWIYTKLSGPGWLQSAITLGSGSLSSSLFLGLLVGFSLMWLQPLAMILGVVMLSAIAYVALSTGRRPFDVVNSELNPVLGWGWALATAIANVVWCLPQFSVGTACARLNLFPGLIGPGAMSETAGKLIAASAILLVCIVVIWFYDTGSRGIRIFEWILKAMVGLIIVCFFGVVIKMSLAGALDWGRIFRGLIPDLSILTEPAKTLAPAVAATGEFAAYWKKMIVDMQRDVMISAFATAVGINMTFLLPYSMLAKGWRRNARGLAIFDLSTGLFVPFILATGCVVIASATQFHAKYHPGLVGEPYRVAGTKPATPEEAKLPEYPKPDKLMITKYNRILDGRLKHELGAEKFAKLSDEEKTRLRASLPLADKKIAAMLIKRSAFDLARSLRPLTGDIFSHYIFGIGVIGMAISSIIILMLISGFVICEMFGLSHRGNAHRLACMLPAVGFLGPFIWTGGKAQFWLAMPTSVFCGALIPVAYWTFFCLMNSRRVLGHDLPRGGRRVAWNALMILALAVVTPGSLWIIWNKARIYGLAVLGIYLLLLIVVQVARRGRAAAA